MNKDILRAQIEKEATRFLADIPAKIAENVVSMDFAALTTQDNTDWTWQWCEQNPHEAADKIASLRKEIIEIASAATAALGAPEGEKREIERLRRHIELHAGDTLSLDNEATRFREELLDAQTELASQARTIEALRVTITEIRDLAFTADDKTERVMRCFLLCIENKAARALKEHPNGL